MQILFQDVADFWRQRQDARAVAFAEHAHLRVGQLQVGEPESEDFTGTQTIQQHQPHQGEIAEGTKAVPELGDFVCRPGAR